mgnify:CR=1 FL=1
MQYNRFIEKESIELNSSCFYKTGRHRQAYRSTGKGRKHKRPKNAYKKDILAREQMSSTAVGDGIAIPHAKSEAVRQPGLAAITAPNGVDYESMDGKPSNILFMIAAPNDGDLHLEVLSRLMTILMDEDSEEIFLQQIPKKNF